MKTSLCFIIITCFLLPLTAQNWIQKNKLVAADREHQDWFGSAVSISGDYAIVGAFFEDENANGIDSLEGAGSAYIYKRDNNGNWSQTQKLVASDRDRSDAFGISVAISGNYAVIGASSEGEESSGGIKNAGAAYFFERDGNGNWSEVQKVVAPDRAEKDAFGASVAINDNHAVIGAYLESEDATSGNTLYRAGSVYVFERDGNGQWNHTQKLVASDRNEEDEFGISISIDSIYLIVGSIWEDHDLMGNNFLSKAGAAYIFEKDGSGNWHEVQKIISPNRSEEDWFGYAVSISGKDIIVGSIGEEINLVSGDTVAAGAAYIFRRDENDNWNYFQQIVATDRTSGDGFGYSVGISNGYSVIGALGNDTDKLGKDTLNQAGAIYIFKKDASGKWIQVDKLVPSDREIGDSFGFDAAIDGFSAISGAFLNSTDTLGGNFIFSTGSAYIFETTPNLGLVTSFPSPLTLSPNPTTGAVTLNLGQRYRTVTLKVCNLIGQAILTETYPDTEQLSFDIKSAAGIYVVEVQAADGAYARMKIVKQ